MLSNVKRVYTWMGTRVHSRYADVILGLFFYLEAIFFIPTDPMLIVYCIERRDRAYVYATIATICSVLGGLTGYFIGYWLWMTAGQQIIHNPLVSYVMQPDTFHYLCGLYKKYEALAILAAAFTPIPYKAATLTAGFCNLSLMPFIIASLIGRGARFYLYAITISIWGEKIKQYIDRYFNMLVVLAMVLIVGAMLLMKKS
ncbi:MAG: VTT domain-containing protein [Candidatus Dependentiae bacterium]|nr:VTT domain-containing protein [Candidatus Dependentiae bacterium]